MTNKQVTLSVAAEMIGCTRQNVLYLVDTGVFKTSTKISNEQNSPYLIAESEVLEYLKKRTKPFNKKAE